MVDLIAAGQVVAMIVKPEPSTDQGHGMKLLW